MTSSLSISKTKLYIPKRKTLFFFNSSNDNDYDNDNNNSLKSSDGLKEKERRYKQKTIV